MATGIAHKYGNDVDTDVIMPARYITLTDRKDLAQHCMEDIDRNFASTVKKGDVIVAGENFGCGSSREHAPIGILASGISCVIARSFARIFYRNAINIGLPIIVCPEAADAIQDGDQVQVDLVKGLIEDLSQGTHYSISPFPPFIQSIIQAKGLVNYTKKNMEDET